MIEIPELLYPPSLTFWQALQKGMVPALKDAEYLAWVASRPCVITGDAAHAHHLVGHGLKPVGGKVSDYLAFPLSPVLHQTGAKALHVIGHKAWEELHESQLVYVAMTLTEAVYRGVIRRV